MDFSHLHKVLDDPNANITVEQCRSFLYELLDQSTRNSDECDLHDEFDAMRYYDGASTAYRLALELLSHVKQEKTETSTHPNRYCLYFGTAEIGLPGRCLKAPGVQMCPASECLFRKAPKGVSAL